MALAKVQSKEESHQESPEQSFGWNVIVDDKGCLNRLFMPEDDNVIFASALDGWGFTISNFVPYLSKKISERLPIKKTETSKQWLNKKPEINDNLLSKALYKAHIWGDYYIDMRHQMIRKGALSENKKPLFVSMILDNNTDLKRICV